MISSSYIKLWKEEFIIFRCVCWCWKLTSCSIYPKKIACLSHLQLKNSEGCSTANLIAIGHIHGLEEAWLLVLVGHPHHPPPLALHANPNPNGFLYPMPNPPNLPMMYFASTISLQPIARILQRAFLHFQDSKRKWDLPIHLLLLSFTVSYVSPSMAKSSLQIKSKILNILQLFHIIWRFVSLHTWEHQIIACLTLGIVFSTFGEL